MASDERTFQQVVAANSRRLREARGFSQDDVAAQARALGAEWQRTTVANIENGRKAPSVEVLILLAVVLGDDAAQRPALLSDFARYDGRITIDGALSLPAELVAGALEGEALDIAGRIPKAPQEQPEQPAAGPGASVDAWQRVRLGWREADSRAAKRAGLAQDDAELIMARLWGTSLSEQSALRAGPDVPERAIAQRKGRESRALSAELEDDAVFTRMFLEAVPELVESSRAISRDQWVRLGRAAIIWAEVRDEPELATDRETVTDQDRAEILASMFEVAGQPDWVTPALMDRLSAVLERGEHRGDGQ